MNFNFAFIALSVSATLFAGMANATISGVTSAELTIKTQITTGTCQATTQDGAGTTTSTVAFGDTFKSDLVNKTRVEPLTIKLTNCSGVSKATVQAKPGSGGVCSGDSADGDSYSGGLNTGFEIWSGEVDSGVLMSCKTPPAAQEVTITSGAGQFPMKSRIVVAKGKTISDVGTGAVTAPVTFVVTYP
ncbi:MULTISPECIES: fimbrial protein [Enterobacter]|uniref:fimbrial protein n=1 Tax=Enterobacter TaxID=547 RepID=UPI002F4278C1